MKLRGQRPGVTAEPAADVERALAPGRDAEARARPRSARASASPEARKASGSHPPPRVPSAETIAHIGSSAARSSQSRA